MLTVGPCVTLHEAENITKALVFHFVINYLDNYSVSISVFLHCDIPDKISMMFCCYSLWGTASEAGSG